jgi:hypothetical protein
MIVIRAEGLIWFNSLRLFQNLINNNMNVLVFTTSVSAPHQVDSIKPLLSSRPEIEDWNFDLEDCDNILRVVSDDKLSPRYIESILNKAGFACEELAY